MASDLPQDQSGGTCHIAAAPAKASSPRHARRADAERLATLSNSGDAVTWRHSGAPDGILVGQP